MILYAILLALAAGPEQLAAEYCVFGSGRPASSGNLPALCESGGHTELRILNTKDGTARQIGSGRISASAEISQDGSLVAGLSSERVGNINIVSASDGSAVASIDGEFTQVAWDQTRPRVLHFVSKPGIDSSRAKVYQQGQVPATSVCTAELKKTGPASEASTPDCIPVEGDVVWLDLQPRGSEALVFSRTGTNTYTLFKGKLGTLKAIWTTEQSIENALRWSPDGGRFAFIEQRENGKKREQRVYMGASDSANPTLRATIPEGFRTTFSWVGNDTVVASAISKAQRPKGGFMKVLQTSIVSIAAESGKTKKLAQINNPSEVVASAMDGALICERTGTFKEGRILRITVR